MDNLKPDSTNPNGQPASLLPCPFCGGEARIDEECGRFVAHCLNPDCGWRDTEQEAIAAWNHRAAVELEDFFYLPKPKQQLFGITTGLSFDDLGIKATGTIDAYTFVDAVLNWQAEMLNEKIVKRICEVWNPERTCKPIGTIRYDYEGGYAGFEYETELSCGHKWRDSYGDYPDYCPNCGAKVVE